MKLEELQPTAVVRGILPESAVTATSVQWFGSEAVELTYSRTLKFSSHGFEHD